MRKILVILLYTIVCCAACKKEAHIKSDAAFADDKIYTIKNGVLAFSSVAAYRQLIEGDKQHISNFITLVRSEKNYTPLQGSAKAKQLMNGINVSNTERLAPTGDSATDSDIADILEDSLFASMVNQDGLVIIGDYMFNIDLVKNKCYALHTNWLSGENKPYYYSLIYNGNSANNYVFEFSTDDEALEILEEWGWPAIKKDEQQLQKRCGEGAVRSKSITSEPHFPYSKKEKREYYIKAKLYYIKLAILFRLNFHYQPHTVGWPLPTYSWEYFSIKGQYWRFKPKCWAERVHPLTVSGPPVYAESGGYANNMWYSTRGLSKYDAQFQIWFTKNIDGNDVTITTGLMQIKDGY